MFLIEFFSLYGERGRGGGNLEGRGEGGGEICKQEQRSG